MCFQENGPAPVGQLGAGTNQELCLPVRRFRQADWCRPGRLTDVFFSHAAWSPLEFQVVMSRADPWRVDGT